MIIVIQGTADVVSPVRVHKEGLGRHRMRIATTQRSPFGQCCCLGSIRVPRAEIDAILCKEIVVIRTSPPHRCVVDGNTLPAKRTTATDDVSLKTDCYGRTCQQHLGLGVPDDSALLNVCLLPSINPRPPFDSDSSPAIAIHQTILHPCV